MDRRVNSVMAFLPGMAAPRISARWLEVFDPITIAQAEARFTSPQTPAPMRYSTHTPLATDIAAADKGGP
jgi:hypothetical protein